MFLTHPPMISSSVVLYIWRFEKVCMSLQRNVKELLSKPTHNINSTFCIVTWVSTAPLRLLFSSSTVGDSLVPPFDFWKIWVPPPFVSEISEKFLRANLSNFGLTNRNHCENTLYYHLSMMYTTNVAKGYNVCCRRQIFEEIYGNLSLKVPIFVLFYP